MKLSLVAQPDRSACSHATYCYFMQQSSWSFSVEGGVAQVVPLMHDLSVSRWCAIRSCLHLRLVVKAGAAAHICLRKRQCPIVCLPSNQRIERVHLIGSQFARMPESVSLGGMIHQILSTDQRRLRKKVARNGSPVWSEIQKGSVNSCIVPG